MRRCQFSQGETIFSEGTESTEAYLLRSGRVEILKATPQGSVRLAVLGDGDVVGEMGLLDERPRSATARAVETVVADAVSPKEFVDLILNQPKQSIVLLRALFERLRTTNQLLAAKIKATKETPGLPSARLVPLTPETQAALPETGLQVIRFPFRIGRKPKSTEGEVLSLNEVDLPDKRPYVLSSNHFAIDLDGGNVIVRDRGSQFGTQVNDRVIGTAAQQDATRLQPGENTIVAGASIPADYRRESPFRFKLILE
jgi:CRP-like cAMP-binding protein